MSTNHLPEIEDVEIYIQDMSEQDVLEWLQCYFDPLTEQKRNKQGVRVIGCFQGESIPIMILEKVTDNFTCLWIDSNNSPWQNDESLAKAAWQAFKKEIRFSREGWSQGEDPNLWWKIDANGLGQISWPDENK